MAPTKKKTVFNAEPRQLDEIQAVVKTGRFRSVSELLREAIDEKLERLRRERFGGPYCREVSLSQLRRLPVLSLFLFRRSATHFAGVGVPLVAASGRGHQRSSREVGGTYLATPRQTPLCGQLPSGESNRMQLS